MNTPSISLDGLPKITRKLHVFPAFHPVHCPGWPEVLGFTVIFPGYVVWRVKARARAINCKPPEST
jgi:hypothetical protein